MDPSPLIADTEAALQQYGSPVTLRRLPSTDAVIYATVRYYAINEMVGGVKQGDWQAIISSAGLAAASWPVPPRSGDLMIIAGRPFQVMGADAITIGGVDVRYNLQIRGTG